MLASRTRGEGKEEGEGDKKGREMLRRGEGNKLRGADTESTEPLSVCVSVRILHFCTFVNTHSPTLNLDMQPFSYQ